MTKQEIKQAADEYRDVNFNNEIEYEALKKAFIAGAEMVNSKQPYTAEDMQEFAEWCSKEGWRYNAIRERWFDKTLYNEKTTDQMLDDFKIWKEEQK